MRRKPVLDERIRLAWSGLLAGMTRDELVALHYHLTNSRKRNPSCDGS